MKNFLKALLLMVLLVFGNWVALTYGEETISPQTESNTANEAANEAANRGEPEATAETLSLEKADGSPQAFQAEKIESSDPDTLPLKTKKSKRLSWKERKAEEERNRYQKTKLTRDDSEAQSDRRTVFLSPGESKIIDLDFTPEQKDPVIVNEKVVKIQTIGLKNGGTQLVFHGLSEGQTNVIFRDPDGTVKVLFKVRIDNRASLQRAAEEIRRVLKEVEGIQIRIAGDVIIVDGEVLTPQDYGRVFSITSSDVFYPTNKIVNLVNLSPISLQVIAKRIEGDVKPIAEKVSIRVVNGRILLEGSVPNIQTSRRVEKIANIYLPDSLPPDPMQFDPVARPMNPTLPVVQNLLQIEPPPPKKQDKLLRVTFHFVELAKDYKKIFGFKWQPGFTTDPTVTVGVGATQQGASGAQGGTSLTATITSLIPKLQSAQDAGFARVLKTATLMVRSGQPGKFDDQAEIPFVVFGNSGQPVSRDKKVGVSIAVTPTILGETEDVQMDLNMKQSNVTAVDAFGIHTSEHSVGTKLYVKSADSAAIAGIESTNINTQFNKDDPRAGGFNSAQTSALFSVIRSKNYTKSKGQFVIFVTPQIIQDASQGSEDLKRNFRLKVN